MSDGIERHFTVPFFIGNNSQLAVSVDDKPLDSSEYRQTLDGVVLNFPAHQGSIITIKRVTQLTDATVKLVLEEVQSELGNRDEEVSRLCDRMETLVSGSDKINEQYATGLFFQAKKEVDKATTDFYEALEIKSEELSEQIKTVSTFLDYHKRVTNQGLQALTQELADLKSSHHSWDISLSGRVTQETIERQDQIEMLNFKIDSLHEKLTEFERPKATPRMATVHDIAPPDNNSAEVAQLTELLNQTRSALNMETQMRRREDAQIKALLKRLLEKFERLEDYLAGTGVNITDTVLTELRRESRHHDDKLGRIALRLTVLTEELKEYHSKV